MARRLKEYNAWRNMRARCRTHPEYAGRGITICSEWDSFDKFLLDMGWAPSRQLTLERIDNDKGYFKVNCMWATRTAQNWNRRTFRSNSSGIRGVCYHSVRNLWIAQAARKQLYYGPSREAAVAARQAWDVQQIAGV